MPDLPGVVVISCLSVCTALSFEWLSLSSPALAGRGRWQSRRVGLRRRFPLTDPQMPTSWRSEASLGKSPNGQWCASELAHLLIAHSADVHGQMVRSASGTGCTPSVEMASIPNEDLNLCGVPVGGPDHLDGGASGQGTKNSVDPATGFRRSSAPAWRGLCCTLGASPARYCVAWPGQKQLILMCATAPQPRVREGRWSCCQVSSPRPVRLAAGTEVQPAADRCERGGRRVTRCRADWCNG